MDNPQEQPNESVQAGGAADQNASPPTPEPAEAAADSNATSDPSNPTPSALNEAMAAEAEHTVESEAQGSAVQMPAGPQEPPRADFGPLGDEGQITDRQAGNISLLLDVKLPVAIELGRTKMSINEILELGSGSIVELDKLAGEPVDILVNNKPLAKGEVVVLDENFGVRITSLVSPRERLERLNSQ